MQHTVHAILIALQIFKLVLFAPFRSFLNCFKNRNPPDVSLLDTCITERGSSTDCMILIVSEVEAMEDVQSIYMKKMKKNNETRAGVQ